MGSQASITPQPYQFSPVLANPSVQRSQYVHEPWKNPQPSPRTPDRVPEIRRLKSAIYQFRRPNHIHESEASDGTKQCLS